MNYVLYVSTMKKHLLSMQGAVPALHVIDSTKFLNLNIYIYIYIYIYILKLYLYIYILFKLSYIYSLYIFTI